jgi:hypothetical protein
MDPGGWAKGLKLEAYAILCVRAEMTSPLKDSFSAFKTRNVGIANRRISGRRLFDHNHSHPFHISARAIKS